MRKNIQVADWGLVLVGHAKTYSGSRLRIHVASHISTGTCVLVLVGHAKKYSSSRLVTNWISHISTSMYELVLVGHAKNIYSGSRLIIHMTSNVRASILVESIHNRPVTNGTSQICTGMIAYMHRFRYWIGFSMHVYRQWL